jgi:hypothetical protein
MKLPTAVPGLISWPGLWCFLWLPGHVASVGFGVVLTAE